MTGRGNPAGLFPAALLKKCWFLCGPTACGKTAVSLSLAKRLNAEIVKLFAEPAYEELFISRLLLPATSSPEEFGAFIRNEIAQNIKIAKSAGIAITWLSPISTSMSSTRRGWRARSRASFPLPS